MKVLALASYPVEFAATRYRLTQFAGPLAERGIELTIRPFLNSREAATIYRRDEWPRTAAGLLRASVRRLEDVWRARAFDALLVQREAMIWGPPVVEWLSTKIGRCPMVLDLDDATYVRYLSPTYGRLGSALKWFSKTDDLIRWARVATCGNKAIAEYVEGKGTRAVIVPTVADTEHFRPAEPPPANAPPILGWIGTHSTFPYLASIFPALQQLARTRRFRLKVIGAERGRIDVPGVEVESLGWKLAREIEDFQSFDIGLYPLIRDEWSAGKSGFKAIQYMACGLPFVVMPVGAAAEIGEPGVTHLNAESASEWHDALSLLLSDTALRKRMGEAGRQCALRDYTVPVQADKLAAALREAVQR